MTKSKKFKKLVLVVPMTVALVLSAGLLTACGDKEAKFTANKNLATATNAEVSAIADKAYNNSKLGNKTTYTLDQLNEALNAGVESAQSLAYYVEVGTLKNFKDVKNIELGGQKFTKEQKVAVSIGNSNFISDNVYKVVDNKLYVAAPVVSFETTSTGFIKINDKKYDLALNPANSDLTLTLKSVTGGKNDVAPAIEGSDVAYTAKIADAREMILMDYEGAEATDLVLTRKVLNGTLNGYGLTNLDGNSIGFYATNYTDDLNKVNSKYQGATWDYSAYVIGEEGAKGIANVKFGVTYGTHHVTDRASFNDALYWEAEEGSYVVLENDIVLDENTPGGLYCQTKATLDLNGHSIIVKTTDGSSLAEKVQAAITLYEGADLTIVGNGTIDGSEADVFSFTLDGGKLTVKDGTYKGSTHTVYVIKGEATILGGNFSVVDNEWEGEKNGQFLLNLLDANGQNGTASIVVKGGSFENYDPSHSKSENPEANFVAEGFTVVANNNVYTVVPVTNAE